jgi:hypothetical protein
MNTLLSVDVGEIAAQLLARPRGSPRQPLSAAILRELWAWSASETRRENFCIRLNEARRQVDSAEPLLLELVREEQLASAVSIHATNHGEIIVREIVPDLFAILTSVAS